MAAEYVWITVSALALVFSALFSGVEIAYISSDRVRARLDSGNGGVIAGIIGRFYGNSELFISSILVGNNIMLVIYGLGAAKILEPWLQQYIHNEGLLLIAQTLLSTLIILLTGEFLPKSVARINPNNSLKAFALPVYFFYVLFYPVSWMTAMISRGMMRLLGVGDTGPRLSILSIGDLNDYLEETIDSMEEQKEEVENEVKIFQNALDFSHTHLRDCMLPRTEIVAVDIDNTTRDQLVELFTRTGRSKILVYRNDIDNILGYIHVSELFNPDADWREHIKDVLYAPETLLANKMMRRLLNEKRSIAIVIDEFGGTAGLVTLEDLVEEIFGDIRDEHDNTQLTARRIAPGVYEFAGRCEIEYINSTYDLDIREDDDYQTIAGYIIHSTGTLPEQGATVMLRNMRFDILKTTANRIELVRVTVEPPPA